MPLSFESQSHGQVAFGFFNIASDMLLLERYFFFAIGPYRFTARMFQQLINYVWQGGYSRWKNGVRPSYVLALQQAFDQSNHPLVEGMQWES